MPRSAARHNAAAVPRPSEFFLRKPIDAGPEGKSSTLFAVTPKVAVGVQLGVGSLQSDVCFWPKADQRDEPFDVQFWG